MTRPQFAHLARLKKITLLVIVATFLAYRLCFNTGSVDCLVDLSHEVTAWLNHLVN